MRLDIFGSQKILFFLGFLKTSHTNPDIESVSCGNFNRS